MYEVNVSIDRDSRKSRQNGKKTRQTCENRKNKGKNMASNHGPEDHFSEDRSVRVIFIYKM